MTMCLWEIFREKLLIHIIRQSLRRGIVMIYQDRCVMRDLRYLINGMRVYFIIYSCEKWKLT